MEFLNHSIAEFSSSFVSAGKIIGVEDNRKVSIAFAALQLNPRINHLIVFTEGSKRPVGVLDRKKLFSEFQGAKSGIIWEACRKSFGFIDIQLENNVLNLRYCNFLNESDLLADAMELMLQKHQERSDERLDYIVVYKRNKDIATIITYKDLLKLISKNVNADAVFSEIPFTAKETVAKAIKGQKISDILDSLSDFQSLPVFENDTSFNLLGIIFRNSVSMSNIESEVEVTDPRLITPVSRFANCKVNLNQNLKEVINLYIQYPEFSSVPVFDEKGSLFLGVLSYIDIFKWALSQRP